MKILDLAIEAAQNAGKHILKESKNHFKVDEKGKNDLVTSIDKSCEELIIKKIKSVYPKHAFLGEESQFIANEDPKNLANAEYIWIIDPIDGTTNFVHGLPQFSISIAAFKTKEAKRSKNFDYLEGELVAGVVYAPKMKELFYAEKNKGAFLNGEIIKVSSVKKVKNAMTVTGFPPGYQKENLPYFLTMMKECQAIRRLGSAALDLAYTACGRFDCYFETGLKPWDIAAGALIVKEAGGKVTDLSGNLLDLFGMEILATNKTLHKEVLKIFEEV